MPAGVVGDHGMGHAVLAELPGGQRRALVARPRLVDPDMDSDAALVRGVDRRGRGAPIDGGEPAGVAMGENLDRFARLFFARGDRLDELHPVPADRPVDGDVLLADRGRARIGRGDARGLGEPVDRGADLVEPPFEVDRGRPRGKQRRIGALERGIGGIGAQRQAQPIGGGRPDQRRAAHLHGADGGDRVVQRHEPRGDEFMRQPGLVDDADRPAVVLEPNGAQVLAVDLHGASFAL